MGFIDMHNQEDSNGLSVQYRLGISDQFRSGAEVPVIQGIEELVDKLTKIKTGVKKIEDASTEVQSSLNNNELYLHFIRYSDLNNLHNKLMSLFGTAGIPDFIYPANKNESKTLKEVLNSFGYTCK